jgi:hypothetical protein
MSLSMSHPLVSAIALTFGLSLLFATVGASNTAGLPFWQAWLHWLLHIGTGLSLALLVANLYGRSPRLCALPLPAFLLLTGVLGALSFAPVALWFEGWLPQSGAVDDDPLDRWAASGGLRPYAAEFLHLAPSYLLSWFLLNAGPLIAARRSEAGNRPDAGSGAAADHREPASDGLDLGSADASLRGNDGHDPVASPVVEDRPDAVSDPGTAADIDARSPADAPGILDRLPPAIGSDLVSASAELHYLEVVTTRGRATLLGRLSQLEVEMGVIGLRVHRSHWVSLAHVRRVYRSRHGWQCELRDGRRLPIARRRVSDVQDRLGRDFVLNATAE